MRFILFKVVNENIYLVKLHAQSPDIAQKNIRARKQNSKDSILNPNAS